MLNAGVYLNCSLVETKVKRRDNVHRDSPVAADLIYYTLSVAASPVTISRRT